ncbi:MAG: HAD family hydrolase [Candidatus Hydrogenedentes bacterium]|nr:HAD family hydrolase [Candidatus Hydrogenedentota bacterium]
MAIRAITFDFWRTLFKEAGNQTARQRIRMDALIAASGVSEQSAEQAFSVVYAEFERSHREDQRTLRPEDSVAILARELGVSFEPHTAKELAHTFATAIVYYPAVPIEGALDAVRAAAKRVPIGIISDVGMSPSPSIRALLERNGFLEYFTCLVFSDQIGVSKPQAPMFDAALRALAIRPEELLHVGDLEYTDIAGANAIGATAGLFVGDNDTYAEHTTARHTFTSWAAFIELLPALLAG